MLELIQDFPNHITEGIEIAEKSIFSAATNEIKNVVLCGMGGSGIGAKIVVNAITDEASVPVVTVNDYFLPSFINENTLVVASSYSGNTEETLKAFEQASSKKAKIVCISSGGRIKSLCEEKKYDCVLVPPGRPPRSALAYSMVQILNILSFYNVIPNNKKEELNNSAELLTTKIESIKSKGESLANYLYKKVGVFYSETKYEGVMIRARQQVNENSKYLAWHHVIPEMNHNELVGWGGGDTCFAPVFFETEDVFYRNKKRFEISKKAIIEKATEIHVVKSEGKTTIEKMMYFIHVIDWASFYLCELNKADIIDISIIDHLKSELSKM